MFNLNINWLKIIKENIPFDLQNLWIIDFIQILISPFKKIHQEFLMMYQVYVYKIRFNGQVQYLEKILNDKFDPVSAGIYIIDGNPAIPNYIYIQSESNPPIYLYRKWNSAVNYTTGQFSIEGNKVYKSLSSNTNKLPSTNPTDWDYEKEVTFIRRTSEFYIQFDFIVKVPSSLVFNLVSMKAIIDFYRLAGKRYKIEYI